jgi:hypothetical protein
MAGLHPDGSLLSLGMPARTDARRQLRIDALVGTLLMRWQTEVLAF